MNYKKYQDRYYNSCNPYLAASKSRGDARGVVLVLFILVGILTLIFS